MGFGLFDIIINRKDYLVGFGAGIALWLVEGIILYDILGIDY